MNGAPRISVELDRERTLLFDFNALASFEEVMGVSVLTQDFNLASVRSLRAFLWAGLLHEQPDLTLNDVGGMLHTGNMEMVSGKVAEALSVAMPGNGDAVKSRKRNS